MTGKRDAVLADAVTVLATLMKGQGYLLSQADLGVPDTILFSRALSEDVGIYIAFRYIRKAKGFSSMAGLATQIELECVHDAMEQLSKRGGGVEYKRRPASCSAILFSLEPLLRSSIGEFMPSDPSGMGSYLDRLLREFIAPVFGKVATLPELLQFLLEGNPPLEWFRPGLSLRIAQIVAIAKVIDADLIKVRESLRSAEPFLPNDGYVPNYRGSFIDDLFSLTSSPSEPSSSA